MKFLLLAGVLLLAGCTIKHMPVEEQARQAKVCSDAGRDFYTAFALFDNTEYGSCGGKTK